MNEQPTHQPPAAARGTAPEDNLIQHGVTAASGSPIVTRPEPNHLERWETRMVALGTTVMVRTRRCCP
jgi:hypothetical protein